MVDTLATKETKSLDVESVERTRNGQTYSPRFDIWETEDELVLTGDLPGVASEDLEIQFENRVLTVYGRVQPRHAGVNFLYGEYGIGDFYRTFSIGESIDDSKISAEMKNGVVTLHLPKSEAVKPRRIEVRSN